MTSTATEITVDTILENRRRWADALRSGDYEQTSGCLYSTEEDAYCCLGVAAKIVGGEVVYPRGGGKSLPENDDSAQFGLLGAAGYVGQTAIIDEGDRHVTLDELNDTYGFTFAEIADLIDDGQVLLHVPGESA